MDHQLLIDVIGAVFAVLWFLLRQKDAAQSRQIDLLFQKHDQDAQSLQDLRVQIASQHYVKSELDDKFDRLESAFRDGFGLLGDKFDRLSEALVDHIQNDGRQRR